ncbi:threonine synthase [Elusimicrobium posterum]|uniref:threonine synthase n=1 Tax=Elusimicrobium posterum TaxID=3116653 RepID=UPI003C78F072
MMNYIDTRGGEKTFNFEEVLLGGLTENGGLYVPQAWPKFSVEEIEAMRGASYNDVAFKVLRPYTEGAFSDEELKNIIAKAYTGFAEGTDIAPVKNLKDNMYVLELFHGPTLAFKDFAMKVLGEMFEVVLKRRDEHITIVGATSGDTGSAAIEAFKDSQHADVFILHPHNRVSDVQRKQMTTVITSNVKNIALEGTFDDCQNIVKALFADKNFKEEVGLSAVNSINWARIAVQIVYYFYAALKCGAPAKEVSFCVPTGNFGNIFAAYAAKQMGLPIKKLVIATNANDILTRFMQSGSMEQKEVVPSLSPSMDIQISSNFERLLFYFCGGDSALLSSYMKQFKETGRYEVKPEILADMKQLFAAYRADDAKTLETIKKVYTAHDVIFDPHTAVGVSAALQYNGKEPVIIAATAHPAKFAGAVKEALNKEVPAPDKIVEIMKKEEVYKVLPNAVASVKSYIEDNI